VWLRRRCSGPQQMPVLLTSLATRELSSPHLARTLRPQGSMEGWAEFIQEMQSFYQVGLRLAATRPWTQHNRRHSRDRHRSSIRTG
jgi:hypothetical protein